jgi:hypothetical protein
LRPDEIDGINNRSLFGFFRVAFVYDDPIGSTRASIYIFVQRPPITNGDFQQVLSSDQIVQAGTVREQKQRQREFVGDMLKIEANPDSPATK